MDAIAVDFNQLTMEDCIQIIGNMPYLLMEHRYGILPDFDRSSPEGQIFANLQQQFKVVGWWLEYYLLVRDDARIKAEFLHNRYYKFLAEDIRQILQLIQEVTVSCTKKGILCPNQKQWWIGCCFELCEVTMLNSGFIGEPRQIGKSASYKEMVKKCNALAEFCITRAKIDTPKGFDELTPLQALEGLAGAIAKEDSRFRENYYKPYLAAFKRSSRQLRDSPMSPTFLVDGNIRTLRNGVTADKRKKKQSKPIRQQIGL